MNCYGVDLRVTEVINKYKQPFDSDYWSCVKAMQRGITQEEILAEWKVKGDKGRERGTICHSFIENYWKNPDPGLKREPQYAPYIDICDSIISFYNEYSPGLKLMAQELQVVDKEYSIGGTIDSIFYSKKLKQLIMLDWKTGKKIDKIGYNKYMKKPINHLIDCTFIHYSLQLSQYRNMLENTKHELQPERAFIVHFNGGYQVIEARDLRDSMKFVMLAEQAKRLEWQS